MHSRLSQGQVRHEFFTLKMYRILYFGCAETRHCSSNMEVLEFSCQGILFEYEPK